MLKFREEMVYKLVYQGIMRDLNNGNSIYEIIYSTKYYNKGKVKSK